MDLAQIRMQDKKLFKCDKKEKLDELTSIRRFLIDNDQIYMFLKNKILIFKIFSLISQTNVSAFEQFYDEDEEKSNKIIGYLVSNKIDENTSDTYELQEEEDKKLKIYKFDFNRMTKIELDYVNFEKLFDEDSKLSLSKIKEDANFNYIYLNSYSNSGVKQQTGFHFKFKGNKIFINLIKNGNLITIRNRPFENNYQIEFAVGYMEDANSNKISIIQIDSEFNFYISQFTINQINETEVHYQFIERKLNDFKSFFNCLFLNNLEKKLDELKHKINIIIVYIFLVICIILVALFLMCCIYKNKQTETYLKNRFYWLVNELKRRKTLKAARKLSRELRKRLELKEKSPKLGSIASSKPIIGFRLKSSSEFKYQLKAHTKYQQPKTFELSTSNLKD